MAEKGFRNILWFMGVVEDRRDPWKMGRVRVRCFDIHPDSKQEVPTEHLPWAIPIIGSYNLDYKPPLEGSWVFGFFLDGTDAQHPMLLGVMPGMPTTFVDTKEGFNSNSDQYPPLNDIWQPDMPKLSRGEDIQDVANVIRKYAFREEMAGYGDIEEPSTPYNAQYPYNKVHGTEGGHVLELDDTPGSERVNLEHSVGTFIEMAPNGNEVHKIKGDSYTIVEKNNVLFVKGRADIVIQGSANVTIDNNCTLNVIGNMETNVSGDYRLNVAGGVYINSGDIFSQKSSSIRQEAFLDSIHHYAKVDYSMEAKNNITINANTGYLASYAKTNVLVESDGDFYQDVFGNTNILSRAGNIAVEGARIDLNTDGAIQFDPYKSSLERPAGARNSLRTLLPDPLSRKFPTEVPVSSEPYRIYTDPDEPNLDEHSIDPGE